MHALILVCEERSRNVKMRETLILSFPDVHLHGTFNAAILGGLLHVARELPLQAPLRIHCCSNFLGKTLVTDRTENENDPCNPLHQLIRTTISALQERSGRIYFKKVDYNPATELQYTTPTVTLIDIQPDLMFTNPGIMLQEGNQRLFTKIIRSMKEAPARKSTNSNLDRV